MPAKKKGLTGAVVVRDLTAEANPKSAKCTAMLSLASPMGPECGGKIIMHNVLVQRVEKIGPARLTAGMNRTPK